MPHRRIASSRSRAKLARLRLVSQRIVGSTLETPEEAVRWMLAIQGQDFASSKWAVGLRVPGAIEAAVDRAIASGAIVRSWPLRGTLHLVAGEDLSWILGLTGEEVVRRTTKRREGLGLDPKTLRRASSVARKALSKGALARSALLDAFDRDRIATDGQRGYHLLAWLGLTGTICFGPPRGKEPTFVLVADWVKRPRVLERDEALGELGRRYFESHGPATLEDFAGWTKFSAKDLKTAFALARPHLAELVVEGTTYWLGEECEERAAGTKSTVLLPSFDEYVLGYQDRGAVIAERDLDRLCPGGNGMFTPTIAFDGDLVGTWRRTEKKGKVLVEAFPFEPLSKAATKGFEEAANDYRRFLERPLAG